MIRTFGVSYYNPPSESLPKRWAAFKRLTLVNSASRWGKRCRGKHFRFRFNSKGGPGGLQIGRPAGPPGLIPSTEGSCCGYTLEMLEQ